MIFFPEFVEKRCEEDGRWEGRSGLLGGERDSPSGWTNYTHCFTPEMLLLFKKLYSGNPDLAQVVISSVLLTKRFREIKLRPRKSWRCGPNSRLNSTRSRASLAKWLISEFDLAAAIIFASRILLIPRRNLRASRKTCNKQVFQEIFKI